MFCRNCGKELGEETKFCPECGVSVDGKIDSREVNNAAVQKDMTRGTDWKKWVIILASLFSSIGGIVPFISMEVLSYTRNYSIIDIAKILSDEKLEELGIEGTAVIFSLGFSALVLAVVGFVIGIGLLRCIVIGADQSQTLEEAKWASQVGIMFSVAMLIMVAMVNHETEEQLYGLKIVKISFWGWLQLIVPIINLLGFVGRNNVQQAVPLMEGAKNGEKVCKICGTKYIFGNQCPECEQNNKRAERICKMCGTRYGKGNQCPECGSTLTEKKL